MDHSASSNNSPSTPRISNSDHRLLPVCPHRPRSSSNSSISISAVATNDDEEISQYQAEKGIPFFPTLASVSSTSSKCMTLMSGSESAAADTSPKRKRNHIEEPQCQYQTTATDNTTEVHIHDISTCQQKIPKLQPRFQSCPVHDDRKPSSRPRRTQQSDAHNVSATSIDFSSSITSVDLPFLDLSLKEEMAATNTALNDLDLDFVWDKAEIDKWMSPPRRSSKRE